MLLMYYFLSDSIRISYKFSIQNNIILMLHNMSMKALGVPITDSQVLNDY